MSEHDFTPLLARYPDTIAEMPTVFTSHEFILKLAQQNQPLYVEALHSYRTSMHRGEPTPFRTVHQILSQRLHDFPALVTHLREVPSTDIFGHSAHCAQWQKL